VTIRAQTGGVVGEDWPTGVQLRPLLLSW